MKNKKKKGFTPDASMKRKKALRNVTTNTSILVRRLEVSEIQALTKVNLIAGLILCDKRKCFWPSRGLRGVEQRP